MPDTFEIFDRTPAEIARLYGAPLGTTAGGPMGPGRANAKGAYKFTKDTGAYNVEIGFDADDAVCYAIFEKKNGGALDEIEARHFLLQCAAGAEWTDVTPAAWNPKAKRNVLARGYRDYQCRVPGANKTVKRVLLARHQWRPGRLAVWTLSWQADIGKELGARIA